MEYYTGVVTAFLIGLVKVCISLNLAYGQRSRNMAKLGLYYNYFQGTFASREKAGAAKVIWFLVYMLVLAPLFSWLSVLSAAWSFISNYSRQSAVPEKMKEIQYKIAHIELSKDQMVELDVQASAILGVTPSSRSGEIDGESDDPFTLVIDPGEWYSEVTVDPKSRRFSFYNHTPDYDGIFRATFEYRFDGLKLSARIFEDRAEHYGKTEFRVKDNVVLESEIRKRHEENKFAFKSADEEVSEYKSQTDWREFSRYDVRFFVMSKHPELFPPIEFRKAIRIDLERIRSGTSRYLAELKKLGVSVIDTAEGFEFRYPNDWSEDKKKEVQALFEQSFLSQYDLRKGEVEGFKKLESDLMEWLGEVPKVKETA